MSSSRADAQTFVVGETAAGERLDRWLASLPGAPTRSQIAAAIAEGLVSVADRPAKAGQRLRAGERVVFRPRPSEEATAVAAEDIALDVLYEDEYLVAINKPAGMVVHPAVGNRRGTLVNAILHAYPRAEWPGARERAGIVHRLDRDTSGIVIVAKTNAAHMDLAAQWAKRTIDKEYFALVAGVPDRDRDRINQPIGVHPREREKMAIRASHTTSREASTFYEVRERFAGFAALQVQPRTGRTHQIRVHLAHIGCPVLCDRLYGGRAQITVGDLCHTEDTTVLLDRQALHAHRLRLNHPRTGTPLALEAPLPADMLHMLEALRRWRS